MLGVFSLLATLLAAPSVQAKDLGQEALPLFVLNSKDANVSVINPSTWVETRRIATGKEPHHVYLTPDEKSLIVANASSDSLTFIDPSSGALQRTIKGIRDPYQLRFSPDMKWFVTAANRLNHIGIYRWDGQELKLVKHISTGKTPSHLWINSTSTVVYATMQDSDELIAIDLARQSVMWRVATGDMPADVFGTADDKLLLVGLTASDGVEVFDVSGDSPKRVHRIATGKGAHAFRAFGDKAHVLVSNRVDNTISKINLQSLSVVTQYKAPGGPDCMEVSADQSLIFVTSRWAGKLSVIDATSGKLKRQVAVGRSPHGVWTLNHAPRQ
jgi:DNA-binding beta-propeller fold protein YncE